MSALIFGWFLAGRSGADWPQFLGPDGAGKSTEKGIPGQWDDARNLAWKSSSTGKAQIRLTSDGKFEFAPNTQECISRLTSVSK